MINLREAPKSVSRRSFPSIGIGFILLLALMYLYLTTENSVGGLHNVLKPLSAVTIFIGSVILIYRAVTAASDSAGHIYEFKNKFPFLNISGEEKDFTDIPAYYADDEYKSYIDMFLETLSDTFVARAAAFYMGGSRMEIQSVVPADESDEFHRELGMGEGIIGKVHQSQSTILVKSINDIAENIDYLKDPKNVKSFLGTPVFYDKKPIGVLFVDSRAEDSFGESDKKLIESFAVLLEKTISQLDSTFNFHNRLGYLSELYRYFLLVQRSKRIEEVINLTASIIKKLVNSDAVTISLLIENKTDTLKIVQSEGKRDRFVVGIEYPVEGGLNGLVIKKNSMIMVPEIEEEGYFKPRFVSDEKTNREYHSYLGAPISIGDEVIGVIGMDSKTPAKFSETDKAILTSVGGMAGHVLSRLNLMREKTSNLLTDSLTDLPNLKHFKSIVTNQILRDKRYEGRFSVLIIDVIKMDRINKKHGRKAGDAILNFIGQYLRESTRISDTKARYGGDELGMILLGTSQKSASEIAGRIKKDLEKRVFDYNNEFITFNVGIGLSSFPDDGETVDEIISSADRAIIKLKHEGYQKPDLISK